MLMRYNDTNIPPQSDICLSASGDPQTQGRIQGHIPELYNKPGVNYYIECWAEVNQRHPQISPSCGKGWCAVHKQLHHPWGCALWGSASSSPQVCHLNRVKKYDTVAMTTLGILHKWFSLCVRAYECLCMGVCVSGRVGKTKKQNDLPN